MTDDTGGTSVRWRPLVGVAAAVVALVATVIVVSGGDDATDPVRGATGPAETTVEFTDSANWVVPIGVTSITITATGEHGADAFGFGGPGATVTGTVPVTPGERLIVSPAGTAGDCSAVFRSVTPSGSIIVAAGGGGAGYYTPTQGITYTGFAGYGGAATGVRLPSSPTPAGGTPGVSPIGLTAQWYSGGLFGSHTSWIPVGFGGLGGLSGFERAYSSSAQPTEIGVGGAFLAGGNGGEGGTSTDLVQWVQGKYRLGSTPVTLTPRPVAGGRGGAGGCGYVGGQGGQGGSAGAGGGGGGGGLSFIAADASAVTWSLNTRTARGANVTITYATPASSTITVATTAAPSPETTLTTVLATTTTAPAATVTTTIGTTAPVTPATAPPAPTYRAMNVYSLRTVVAVPTGMRVRSAKVAAASRRVCVVVRELVVTLASGTCKVTATVSNGRKKQKITTTITVAP